MQITIPQDVNRILTKLTENGFRAYIVGGCVRDSLLNRPPKDYDITTDATPYEVKKLFRSTIDTGIKHGTVTVLINHVGYEVTTFRTDGLYEDHRHPKEVTFTPELSEDLKRRDFTINAMAYNDSEGLIDLYGGIDDLTNKRIRCVGNPEERFQEDALRILRCIRFSAELSFSIEEETYKAARKFSENLTSISGERIREELLKTLLSNHPCDVEKLDDIGALKYLYPEFSSNKEMILSLLKSFQEEPELRLLAFLTTEGDLAVATASRILKDLRFDNKTRDFILHFLTFRDRAITDDPYDCRLFLNAFGKDQVPLFFTYISSYRTILLSEDERMNVRSRITSAENVCISLIEDHVPTSVSELMINGNDLLKMGAESGKKVGELLMKLLDEVLKDPAKNEREVLLTRAKAIIRTDSEAG